ncbi:Fe-S cluster assembly sulfur transfer protein SufU [Wohlfahrtiimonas sp. G9077]|uniref:Fe-S cluster assembly sulfur transfer protein SufU n=1 Tax=Wohlfahrtiimonas sp. G9077 TaxID=1980118 RepID=UPI0018F13EF8|nr:SUF system NifU family Fe-S cluster assembly protein [Wohlfahrtiimonas sp. G9077]
MMDSDLQALYQEVILDHNKKPRNFRVIDPATHAARGHNPLCGDQIKVFLTVDDNGVIQDVSFKGEGCAISTASSSLMTEAVKGKTIEEAEKLYNIFHDAVTTDEDVDTSELGRLAILTGVKKYPARVKCATLAWHALHAALTENEEPVKTE